MFACCVIVIQYAHRSVLFWWPNKTTMFPFNLLRKPGEAVEIGRIFVEQFSRHFSAPFANLSRAEWSKGLVNGIKHNGFILEHASSEAGGGFGTHFIPPMRARIFRASASSASAWAASLPGSLQAVSVSRMASAGDEKLPV